jgi:hypothetical protein
MEQKELDLNARIARDAQVIRDGADIDVLHNEFVPISSVLSDGLKVSEHTR